MIESKTGESGGARWKNYAKIGAAIAVVGLVLNLYSHTAHCYAYPPLKTVMRFTYNDKVLDWSREHCLIDEQMSTYGGAMEVYRSIR